MAAPRTANQRAFLSRAESLLRQAILDGHFLPGQRLIQEVLADFIGTSRAPVREALKSLASEGMITLVENTGAWVTSYTQAQCIEMYRVRERLEPLLLELSLPYLTDEQMDRLEDLRVEIDAADDVSTFITLDREFHLASYAGHHEPFLHDTVERLWNNTQHYRRRFVERQTPTTRQRISAEHALLVDTIRRRDAEGAGAVLELHIRRTRHALAEASELFDD